VPWVPAENDIVGEALIALMHDDLKSMGINSVGHRLTILKSVYDVKKAQDVPIESDHYVPLCMFQPFWIPTPLCTPSYRSASLKPTRSEGFPLQSLIPVSF
jgi:hypothetical protein